MAEGQLKKWDQLTAEEKKLFIRRADVFAAYVAYNDHEIGRVVQAVEDMGKLDNTLIIYINGDNGTSAEGGPIGTPNEVALFNGVNKMPVDMQMRWYDAWGTEQTYNHMSAGWSWAFDTPFSWFKQNASKLGGVVSTWRSPGPADQDNGVFASNSCTSSTSSRPSSKCRHPGARHGQRHPARAHRGHQLHLHLRCGEPADQPLDLVALAVGGFVEIELAGLILAGGDHRLDPALSEAATGRRTGVAPVACCPAGTQARAASPLAWHHALVHESIQRKLLVALARRQHRRDRLTPALGTQMQLGREAALAAPERFAHALDGRSHPPMAPDRRAPAACWWARTTVASTKCRS